MLIVQPCLVNLKAFFHAAAYIMIVTAIQCHFFFPIFGENNVFYLGCKLCFQCCCPLKCLSWSHDIIFHWISTYYAAITNSSMFIKNVFCQDSPVLQLVSSVFLLSAWLLPLSSELLHSIISWQYSAGVYTFSSTRKAGEVIRPVYTHFRLRVRQVK